MGDPERALQTAILRLLLETSDKETMLGMVMNGASEAREVELRHLRAVLDVFGDPAVPLRRKPAASDAPHADSSGSDGGGETERDKDGAEQVAALVPLREGAHRALHDFIRTVVVVAHEYQEAEGVPSSL